MSGQLLYAITQIETLAKICDGNHKSNKSICENLNILKMENLLTFYEKATYCWELKAVILNCIKSLSALYI